MSTQKSKEELVRLAWITALRREGHRQCYGAYYAGTHHVCGLSLLAIDILGMTRNEVDDAADEDIAARAGLRSTEAHEILCRNDGDNRFHKHTFSEIADVIEGWFK